MRLPLRALNMNWMLAPGVGYCEAGGELVFLPCLLFGVAHGAVAVRVDLGLLCVFPAGFRFSELVFG